MFQLDGVQKLQQATHEEQNLLERLCGLGLGYFKYSADILSAVS